MASHNVWTFSGNLGSDPETRQASALIGAIIDRTKAGLCTYRQAVCLLRAGKRMDVQGLTFDAAQDAIGEMIETEPGDALGLAMDPFSGSVW